MNRHEVVAGALILDRKVLLCHRSSAREWYPNVWDLPGGHVEPGETPSAALVRELAEEIGVHIAGPEAEPSVRLERENLDLRIYRIERWQGEAHIADLEEHDEIGWFDPDEVAVLELAHPLYESILARLLLRPPKQTEGGESA